MELKKPNYYHIPKIVAEKVKPHEAFIFSVVYWFQKMKDGRCFASNQKISEALPYKSSNLSVSNALLSLEKQGFIKRVFKDESQRIRTEIVCLVDYQVSSTDDTGIIHRLYDVSSTGEQNSNKFNSNNYKESTFPKFWKEYPKKTEKRKSEDIWKRKKLDPKIDEILEFIEKAKQTDRWKKGYIKGPAVFLRNENWEDDLEAYNDYQSNKMEIKKYS